MVFLKELSATVRLYKKGGRMKRGEITIFLAMLLSGICALLCVIIESARTQAMRLQIEILMDMGLHSCFGEYHQELFGRYDLLYIDSSYNKAAGGVEEVLTHLEQYLNENISQGTGQQSIGAQSNREKSGIGGQQGDWFKLSVDTVRVKQYLLASDFNGHIFQNQAARYLKNYGDSSRCFVLEQGANNIVQNRKRDFYGEWEVIQNRIDGYGKSFYNPADEIRSYSNGDLLRLAVGNGVAGLAELPYPEVPSKRSMEKGNLPHIQQEIEDAELLFDEYMLQKCAEYTDVYQNRVLCCELEYILYGNPSDRENLKQAVQELMELRESENLNCLLSEEGKREEAQKLAEQLVGAFELAGLTEAVRDSVIYAWAYAESAIEVGQLLSGGRIMIKKQAGDWILPLEELLEFPKYMGRQRASGFTYEEYLGFFLRRVEADQKIARCMDIVEINIRQSGNQWFRIDGCVEYLDAEVFFESRNGYRYQIRREFGYELQETN